MYYVDPNSGGEVSRLRIAELFWGRLVDVHDVDAFGNLNAAPVFRDFVINENIQSDFSRYRLETNPITQRVRLVILRTLGAPNTGSGTFASLARQASSNLPPVTPKNDNGSSPEPFSFMARNAALVIRFDDMLDDSSAAALHLAQDVKVQTGYPPVLPFTSRLIFDPNHGGIRDGSFHSTRVIVDMTVSETETASMPVPVQVNSVGLPSSLTTSGQPNVSIRIPSTRNDAAGQFTILRGANGSPMATTSNGPVDFGLGTLPVVRALRAGNETDANNGFMLDLNQPEISGAWPLAVTSAITDTAGEAGFDFVVDMQFSTLCQTRPEVDDIVSVGSNFVTVTELGAPPDPVTGVVNDVRVRILSDLPLPIPNALIGSGLFLSTFDPLVTVPTGCWVTFTPQPGVFPAADVQPDVQITVRFTEPMDPASLQPFDTFQVIRADANTPEASLTPLDTVIGTIRSSSDLKDHTYTPTLPLRKQGASNPYHVRLTGGLAGVTDLAGNALAENLPRVDFSLDSTAAQQLTGGFALRFNEIAEFNVDEGDPPRTDLRGQLFYDLERGLVRPRPVTRTGVPADRGNPVPGLMVPFPPGVQTPLSPLGSKLQTLWRYADLGWLVNDETTYNIDVEGLNWSPIGGQIVADFYENFEIRLAHSNRLPDEYVDINLLPVYGQSGLRNSNEPYRLNILDDPLSPQVVVHNRALGYSVNPIDLFLSATGTPFMPFPLNRAGAAPVTYTWRDTSVLAKAAPNGTGIPMAIEARPPLNLYNADLVACNMGMGGPAPGCPGSIETAGNVSSYALPLLMEFRCYPSDSGVGLNAFDISLAINSSSIPNFRAFSTGGLNTGGQQIFKDPDLQEFPTGGFNPTSTPPGAPTARATDNSFYIGQLDSVVRISRIHTIWFNTLTTSGTTSFLTPVVEPAAQAQPLGTSIRFDFRGATGFTDTMSEDPFSAGLIDAYGELDSAVSVNFLNGVSSWANTPSAINGARYVQLRMTFFNNIATGLNAELSAFGLAWRD